MRKSALIMIATAAAAVTACANARSATEFGTIEEAKAMLKRAVIAVQQDKIAAINSFNFNDIPFRDRDLFVFCFNAGDGKFTAHEAFVTRDVRKLRDSSGKAFGAEMYDTAKEGRITEITYTAPLPGTTRLAKKRAYVTRVGDQVCGVSAYLTKSLNSALSKVGVAMERFHMFLTLSSLTGPQVLFVTQPQRWKNELACVSALPKLEDAVARLIRYDASALELFGATTDGVSLKPGYFVSGSECRSAEPGGP